MNVQDLTEISNESFDVAIDKGTMDALMCEKGDVWEPSEQLILDVKREVDEVQRILRPGGTFIYITFGQPHFRRRHLERPGVWDIEIIQIGEAFHYFVYIMRKKY